MKGELLVVLAIVVYLATCGCLQYSATVPDTIEYMGFPYGQSERAVLPADTLYFTGCTYNDMKLYADGIGGPEKVPLLLTARNASGYYFTYSRYGSVQSAYAYTPFARYNVGENVTIGLMNEKGSRIELKNSAPYEIEKKGHRRVEDGLPARCRAGDHAAGERHL